MLKKIRIALAALCFTGITLLLLDVSGTLHAWLGWLARIQFLPAVLALNLAVIIGLIVLTLLFGRVYCSVICPLGVWQDIVSNLSGRRKGKKARFTASPERKWLRYGVWVLFVAALLAGVHAFVALLAPYSAWGRIVQNLLQPLYLWGNNLLAWISERMDGYAFYSREVWLRSLPTFLIALGTLAAVSVLAWKNGRTWCNTLCPVGTTLGFFSRFSLFRPVLDLSVCVRCHHCEKSCKASCIDIDAGTIDHSRCVDCFNCVASCPLGGLKYRPVRGKKAVAPEQTVPAGETASDKGRRAFLAGAVLAGAGALSARAQDLAGAAADTDKKRDGGFADIVPKKEPVRTVPITPPGSLSVKHFYRHCTACQLCVAQCPNNVLRPSTDLEHLMQPRMSFERGYCRPECVRCAQVCPAGAILPITPEEKTAFHVGVARLNHELCLPASRDQECGNCARHCPTGAIRMVRKHPDDEASLRIPSVMEERCIGCGACEHLCPARPISAITIDGLADGHKRD